MLKLREMNEFESAKYHGFTLQNGFWYGTDTETGKYIATSGWECNGCVAMYFKNGNSWDMEWLDIEDTDFALDDLAEINLEGKLPFGQWLEEIEGISLEELDENSNNDQEYEEYESYLYDGLPKFVQKYLQ